MPEMWYVVINFQDESVITINGDEDDIRAFQRAWKESKQPTFKDDVVLLDLVGWDDDERKPHPQEVCLCADDIKFLIIGKR